MNDALLDLPPHLRHRLAAALSTGLLSLESSESELGATLGSQIPLEGIALGLASLRKSGFSEPAVATWLKSIDSILNRVRKPDLVWSGPEVHNLHARDTRRVFEELLGSANHSLWASTYAIFDGQNAFGQLAKRMAEVPSLKVSLLLNIQRKKGDGAEADIVIRQFADRFWKHSWPGTHKPKVWFDPRSLELEGPTSVLHAKAVVVDEEQVFITSANLTEAAWDRNIELGILVRDRALAASVVSHFQCLIDVGNLRLLP